MGMKNIKNGNTFAGQAKEKSPLGRPRCRWEGRNDKDLKIIFMVTPCINDINCFIVQLMH